MNFLKTIESSLKKYKVFSEDLKVYRITLFKIEIDNKKTIRVYHHFYFESKMIVESKTFHNIGQVEIQTWCN